MGMVSSVYNKLVKIVKKLLLVNICNIPFIQNWHKINFVANICAFQKSFPVRPRGKLCDDSY